MTDTTNTERLKPCPFCGAGNTEIRQNGRTWTGMKFSDTVSVSVRHWCAEVHGQPTRMIERAGRDEESVIAAWNTRAALADAESLDAARARVAAAGGPSLNELRQRFGDTSKAEGQAVPKRCPGCNSPSPRLHPAQAHEGEVSICPNPWHRTTQQPDAAAPETTTTPAVVQGWKWVPVEPTPEMLSAFWRGTGAKRPRSLDAQLSVVQGAWNYMLAAAPEAPAAPVVEPVAYVELTDAECDEFRRHQGDFNSMLRATHRAGYSRGVVSPPAPREPVEFTDTARSALLWVLWHHQGGSSPVGQPIRHALGIGRHEDLTDAQLAEAKRWGDAHPVNPSVYPRGEAPRERLTMDEVRARFDLPFISDAKAERISDALVELGIGADREGG